MGKPKRLILAAAAQVIAVARAPLFDTTCASALTFSKKEKQ